MPHPPSDNPIGTPFIELQSIDSTNNYAREQIHAGLAPHGMTVFAHEQIAGKGQRGKTWNSEKGNNILMSVLIQPDGLKISEQFQLNACVAIAVLDFFKGYAGDDSSIKWPNDIYWQDRKAGGILIESGVGSSESGVQSRESGVGPNGLLRRSSESVISSTSKASYWKWVIVGIGININQTSFPSYLVNPVSLKQITGKNFDTVSMAKELCKLLDKRYNELLTDGFENIYQTYLEHLYKKDKAVMLKKNTRVFQGTIKSVSRTGKLIVLHAIEEEFDFGEIEWVL